MSVFKLSTNKLGNSNLAALKEYCIIAPVAQVETMDFFNKAKNLLHRPQILLQAMYDVPKKIKELNNLSKT